MHIDQNGLPLIWTKQNVLFNSHNFGQSNCDCGGACTYKIIDKHTQQIDFLESINKNEIFCPANEVFKKKIDKNHSLLTNPISGDLIILNLQAALIYEKLCEYGSIEKITKILPDVPYVILESTIQKLLQTHVILRAGQKLIIESKDSDMLNVWFHVTNRCNLACSYCYVEKNNDTMSKATAKKAILACIRSAKRQGLQHINLKYSGGEAPLVFSRLIKIHKIITHELSLEDFSFEAALLSNGTCLTEKELLILEENKINLMVSLDGEAMYQDAQRPYKNGEGTFERISTLLPVLSTYKIRSNITITLTEKNLGGLPKTVEMLLGLGLPFNINFYRENELAAEGL